MRVGLIPLDERPVNTRYPRMIAASAGAELRLPPAELLSDLRRPADCAGLAEWLRAEFGQLDSLVVDLEMLGFGGLIASRTTHEPAAAAVARLEVLRELRRAHPSVEVLGFSLVTRISNADDATEEPEYWASFGTRLYRLSQLTDRALRGEPVGDELERLRAEVPPAALRDFLRRRHRNHTVNMAALELLADGALDLLVLSSDDTSPYGLGTREKAWLAELAGRLGLLDDGRLLMYPGADEVGCALLARALNRAAGRAPRFAVLYDSPEGAEVVAPYEDGPVRTTVERQIRAVGGALAAPGEAADLTLAVATPVPRRSEWDPAFAEAEREGRLPQLAALVGRARELADSGGRVVVADVAYPNGADPALFELLRARADLTALAGYGAWNTAGNTIGTALAQGCAALDATTPPRRLAAERFLLHRYLEDWGYQQVARRELRDWLAATAGSEDPAPERLPAATEAVARRLAELLGGLEGFAGRWRLAGVRLPWRRMFEVDFDLEPAGEAP